MALVNHVFHRILLSKREKKQRLGNQALVITMPYAVHPANSKKKKKKKGS